MKRPRLVRNGSDWRRPPENCIVRSGTATIASGWAGIPTDVLQAILRAAPTNTAGTVDSMLGMRFTCRDWYHAHSIATSSLGAPRVRECDLRTIANLRNLRRLEMSLCLQSTVSSDSLQAALPALTGLTSLAISRIWNGMSQRLLPAIGNCTGLWELQLGSTAGCECHGTNIEGGIIQDAQFAALVGLRRLESLELSNIIRLSGSSFGQLGPSLGSTLKSLTILGCRYLSDCALEGISGLTQLTFLQLEDCSSMASRRHGVVDTGGPFTDVGLARLASLTKLTALHFAHNGNDIGKSDVGTSAIAANLTALKRLDFSWNENFGDAAARPLGDIKGLAYLDLAYCDQVTDSAGASLEALAGSLQDLRLTRRCADCGEWHTNLPDWWIARLGSGLLQLGAHIL